MTNRIEQNEKLAVILGWEIYRHENYGPNSADWVDPKGCVRKPPDFFEPENLYLLWNIISERKYWDVDISRTDARNWRVVLHRFDAAGGKVTLTRHQNISAAIVNAIVACHE